MGNRFFSCGYPRVLPEPAIPATRPWYCGYYPHDSGSTRMMWVLSALCRYYPHYAGISCMTRVFNILYYFQTYNVRIFHQADRSRKFQIRNSREILKVIVNQKNFFSDLGSPICVVYGTKKDFSILTPL